MQQSIGNNAKSKTSVNLCFLLILFSHVFFLFFVSHYLLLLDIFCASYHRKRVLDVDRFIDLYIGFLISSGASLSIHTFCLRCVCVCAYPPFSRPSIVMHRPVHVNIYKLLRTESAMVNVFMMRKTDLPNW